MKTKEDKMALGTKVAPAVGLLLLGEQALAQDAEGACGGDTDVVSVPEPSTFALFAAGAAAMGVVHAVKKWREK